MSGQGIVTIGGRQWTVTLATTLTEVASGLSSIASMESGTGMLFDLGSDRNSILIDMSKMLFALDIVFINSSAGVVGVLHSVQPSEDAQFQADTTLGARYFLELNAGEAEGIKVGDSVGISGEVQPAFWGTFAAVIAAVVAAPLVKKVVEKVVE